jgi:uncharacterized protein YaeQ
MALKSTVYKIQLQIADMDRSYYGDHAVTIARHPSENDERLMMRLLAFAVHAEEGLAFANGLCEPDEPDLWTKDLTGAIRLWIDVGLPEEKLLRKACGRAEQVVLLAYGRTVDLWWQDARSGLSKLKNLRVLAVPAAASQALAAIAERNLQLQCTVQDGQIWLGTSQETVQLELTTLLG